MSNKPIIHNFPAAVDEFPTFVDWPTTDFDKYANFDWQHVYTSLLAMQQYILTQGFWDRGDPAAGDFDQTDLTTDFTWRDLDLSGIVPAGVRAVLLRVAVQDDLPAVILDFREKGNTQVKNVARITTQVANQWNQADLIVALDPNRKIQYIATNTTWTLIRITVAGWWV